MKKKEIHTCVDAELWKEAQFKDIKWSKAIELGIKILTDNSENIDDLEVKINEKRLEIEFLEKKVMELKKIEKKKMTESRGKIIMQVD